MILIVNSPADLIAWSLLAHGLSLAPILFGGLPTVLTLVALLAIAVSCLAAWRRACAMPPICRAMLSANNRWRLYAAPEDCWYEARQLGPAVVAPGGVLLIVDAQVVGRVPLLITRRRNGRDALRCLRVRLRHARPG